LCGNKHPTNPHQPSSISIPWRTAHTALSLNLVPFEIKRQLAPNDLAEALRVVRERRKQS
jgi:hypothetical protein